MADVTLVDPLGRHVTLHDFTWYGHILKRHPEMRPLRDSVDRVRCQPHQRDARMVTTDTLEGTINRTVSYHYDVFSDVLYLRLVADMETPAVGEESDDGLIELRDQRTGRLVGITVVGWWKRFGRDDLPDSIQEIQRRVEPWAGKLAA